MIVTKALGLVEGGEQTDEYPNGSFDVILSAATLDRDGEVIDARAFEPLPDHIPFDIDHGMTVATTVGSGTPYYAEDGTLRVKGGFASTALAQEVRTLVAEGHIRTTSVTFMAADRVEDSKGVQHVKTAELLNGTFTPVPSNREAVVLSAKAATLVTEAKEGRRNSASDAELIQTAHDAMASMGASCGGKSVRKSVQAPAGAKSIVGSLEAQRDRVQDALEDAYPGRYCYIRGVLPDAVVFDAWLDDDGDFESFRQTYTDDGSVVTLTGSPVEVDVMEIVTPDADADRETEDELKSATDAADAAAKAAASAAEVADVDTFATRQVINENAARFAFGG